ncbi:MAG: hypothetical protein E7548_04665 [Ruminococcaceae bacterium]|nr:hypothetical protein [Oscillospiraceae bacterium]
MKKFLTFFVSIFILITTLCGCGEDYKNATVYYELAAFPTTLDPSVVSDSTATMISSNIYEGLMRLDYDLNVVCGAAESYSVSGNTYTFTLRDNLKWSNGDPLTAKDFVFGLQRSVDPKTNSPSAQRLSCIKNASEIISGKLPVKNLAVSAPDDKTVVIETVNSAQLLKTLTGLAAMPCNEEFFNKCAGEYGMTASTILSNGSYRIRLWDFENGKMRITKNPNYSGNFVPNNTSVILTKDEELSPIQRLENENVDMAQIDSLSISKAKELGLNCLTFENTLWLLTVNDTKFSKDLRSVFAMTFNREKYSKSLVDGYRITSDIFPAVVKGKDTVLSPISFSTVSPQTAFKNATGGKALDKISIVYYDDPVIRNALVDIAGNWQQLFGVTINLVPSGNLIDLQNQLKNKTYDMCLFPITAKDSSLSDYLKQFSVTENDLQKAQNLVLGNFSVIPVAVQDTCYAMTSDITKANVSLRSEIIDFSFVIKKD